MINYTLNNNLSIYTNNSVIIETKLYIIIFSILLAIVMIIGVIGNLFVIYVVLNYNRLKTVTNTYLLHLALSDLIFLSGIPFLISSLINRAWIFGRFICKLFFFTQGVNQYTSIIILALLAFDRFLAVCYPSKSVIWRSRINPYLLLMLTWILSFILMLPIIIFTTVQTSASSKIQCSIVFPYSETGLIYFIFTAYTSTITYILPLGFMIYFYIKIVLRLRHRVPQQRCRSRLLTRTRRKVSILVLIVVSTHICCCSPYWTFQIITTSGLLPQTRSLLMPISNITQFLLFVNSSINPVLYAFLSKVFRLSFKYASHCWLPTNHDQYYLHGHKHSKRNTVSTANRNNFNNESRQITPMNIISSNIKLSPVNSNKSSFLIPQNQTYLSLLHRQNQYLSPKPRVFASASESSLISYL